MTIAVKSERRAKRPGKHRVESRRGFDHTTYPPFLPSQGETLMTSRDTPRHSDTPSGRTPPVRSSANGKAAGRMAIRSRRKPRFKFFHRVVELLQQLLPAKLPVVVRLGSPGQNCLGSCRRLKSQFRICISSDISEEFAVEMLIHEWAHALAWPRNADCLASSRMPRAQRQRPFHGMDWGKAYSEVYCAVVLDIAPEVRRELRASRAATC